MSEISFALGSREEKRSFYKQALRITIPIALQNLMDAAVSSADILMLAFVSQTALSASSLAGNVSFNLGNLLYGVSSAAAVMTAQYWGKGDKKTVEKVMGIAMKIALIVGAIFTLASAFLPEAIMTIFTKDQDLIREGAIYLRVVSISYVLGAFAQIYLSVMRSVERVKMSAVVHSSAVALNVILNACFIFGWGPFPELGIMGVALATTITRVVEVIVCLIDNARCCLIRLKVSNMVRRAGILMKDFLKLAVPAAGNDIIWGVAFSVYSVILGHLSSDIVAANSVAGVVRNMGTVVCFGTSSAAAIILGKAMGDNKMREAKVYARRFVWMSVYTALMGSVVILLLRPLVLDFMHIYVKGATELARSELGTMLLINSYYIIGMSMNTMYICGLFRSGGDVTYGFVCDTLSMWCFAVPVGLVVAFVLKLPEMWVYFILCLDEFIKLPVNYWHYRKMKWIRNITREIEA